MRTAGPWALLATLATAAPSTAEVSFNRHIRPIMSDTCFRCHGPDKSARMAAMRLDLRDEAIKPTPTGVTPIVPGSPERSAIIQRIFSPDAARLMPPAYAHKTLTAEQKDLIRRWVAEGAKYEGHWAYQPMRPPPVPAVPGARVHNPVDAFIQARLAAEGLAPSPEADRRTLIRRVTLDLTGLPPTPQELEADTYEKVVDRLLASPGYAEKQALHWLDAVRYADTCGFHGDNPFPAWPYRDYVLRTFRDNKPFDVFTREQIAGDLLPGAGVEQKVASAFNRLNRTSAEGGLQPKEYLAKYAADRVRTVSAVWLGSTTGCAECHDHKFDPFLSRDFYALKAFFADIQETGLVPDKGAKAWGSVLSLPSDGQRRRLEELNRLLGPVEARKAPEIAWQFQRPLSATAIEGAKLTIYNDEPVETTALEAGSLVPDRKPGNGLIVAGGPNPDNETYTITLRPGEGVWTGLGLEIHPDESLPGVGVSRGADRFVMTEAEADLGGRKLEFGLASSNLTSQRAGLPEMAAIDGNGKTGWGVATYGETRRPLLVLWFAEKLRTGPESVLTVRLRHDSDYRRATIGRFRLALTAAEPPLLDPKKAKLEAERDILEAAIPKIVVTESAPPAVTRILPRGNWMDDSGEIVAPAIPAVFGKLDTAGRPATRLDLANWLVSPDNPLTSRVFVNRLWRQFFGAGLSKVLDDVGSQGEWPVHAELLDWLAAEFVTHGWDVKHVIRTIVLSHAYRQSSAANPALEERDPDNRLLARQSRFRLDAEIVRDVALGVSGLLVDKFGGPSVRPYQPDGYLSALNFPKREYSASRGEDLYRRGVYTHWQRTFLHPSLMTFDAPTREECTINRTTSNTPLQALVLLNDPTYVEAAQAFAGNILRDGGRSLDQKLDWAFLRAVGRKPIADERRILTGLHRKSLRRFGRDPQAAMTAVARAILNLHETITRN